MALRGNADVLTPALPRLCFGRDMVRLDLPAFAQGAMTQCRRGNNKVIVRIMSNFKVMELAYVSVSYNFEQALVSQKGVEPITMQ